MDRRARKKDWMRKTERVYLTGRQMNWTKNYVCNEKKKPRTKWDWTCNWNRSMMLLCARIPIMRKPLRKKQKQKNQKKFRRMSTQKCAAAIDWVCIYTARLPLDYTSMIEIDANASRQTSPWFRTTRVEWCAICEWRAATQVPNMVTSVTSESPCENWNSFRFVAVSFPLFFSLRLNVASNSIWVERLWWMRQ